MAEVAVSKPMVLACDRNGAAITEGDYVRFPGSATKVEGVVYGMTRGVLQIAVPGYGSYGLWPSNAERITELTCVSSLSTGSQERQD